MDIEIKYTEDFSTWLAALRDRKARLIVLSRLDRVAEGNFGDVAPIGEGISEIRIHYGPGYRLYFVKRGNTVVVVLCGGDKSSQSRDIFKAKILAKELGEDTWHSN
jgi:putative addiction module killer protein